MQIQVFNIDELGMPFIRYGYQGDNEIVSVIARNTEQTWQPNRTAQETIRNTRQGKLTEDIFQEYVRCSLRGINILAYDEIRNDNYTKHAPFDFLVWSDDKGTDIRRAVNAVRDDIDNSHSRFVKISDRTRTLCKEDGVKFVEVKSTKIAPRHKPASPDRGNNYNDPLWVRRLADKILGDDFLAYPSMCRTTSSRHFTMDDYAHILNNRGITINAHDDIRGFEASLQLCDIFVRIYLDEPENVAFLVGWIDKRSFYQNADIKKMSQRNKSELALYFAVPLVNRRRFDDLEQFVEH